MILLIRFDTDANESCDSPNLIFDMALRKETYVRNPTVMYISRSIA